MFSVPNEQCVLCYAPVRFYAKNQAIHTVCKAFQVQDSRLKIVLFNTSDRLCHDKLRHFFTLQYLSASSSLTAPSRWPLLSPIFEPSAIYALCHFLPRYAHFHSINTHHNRRPRFFNVIVTSLIKSYSSNIFSAIFSAAASISLNVLFLITLVIRLHTSA